MERDKERGIGKEVNIDRGSKSRLSERVLNINPSVVRALVNINMYGPPGTEKTTCVDHLGRIHDVPYGFRRNY